MRFVLPSAALSAPPKIFFFLGIIDLLRNGIQGMGFSAVTMLSGLAELVMRVVAAFVFAAFWGYTGVCFANTAAWVGADVILVVIFAFIYKKHFAPALRREREMAEGERESQIMKQPPESI